MPFHQGGRIYGREPGCGYAEGSHLRGSEIARREITVRRHRNLGRPEASSTNPTIRFDCWQSIYSRGCPGQRSTRRRHLLGAGSASDDATASLIHTGALQGRLLAYIGRSGVIRRWRAREGVQQIASPLLARSAILANPRHEIRTAHVAADDDHRCDEQDGGPNVRHVPHVSDTKPSQNDRRSILRRSSPVGAVPRTAGWFLHRQTEATTVP